MKNLLAYFYLSAIFSIGIIHAAQDPGQESSNLDNNLLEEVRNYISGRENIKKIEKLLNQGADVNITNDQNETPLLLAMHEINQQKAINLSKLLIKHGANVNAQNIQGVAPIMVAIMFNQEHLTKYLLEQKADPNLQDDKRCTAFEYSKSKYVSFSLVALIASIKQTV